MEAHERNRQRHGLDEGALEQEPFEEGTLEEPPAKSAAFAVWSEPLTSPQAHRAALLPRSSWQQPGDPTASPQSEQSETEERVAPQLAREAAAITVKVRRAFFMGMEQAGKGRDGGAGGEDPQNSTVSMSPRFNPSPSTPYTT